jgi:hypothetical protein
MTNADTPATTSQPTQANAEPRPLAKYRVEFSFTEYSRAVVVIEAASPTEAQEKALDLNADDIGNWKFDYDDVNIDSIEPVEGGQNDD